MRSWFIFNCFYDPQNYQINFEYQARNFPHVEVCSFRLFVEKKNDFRMNDQIVPGTILFVEDMCVGSFKKKRMTLAAAVSLVLSLVFWMFRILKMRNSEFENKLRLPDLIMFFKHLLLINRKTVCRCLYRFRPTICGLEI